MRMCLNKRVLIGLGVVALGVFVVSPRLLGAVAPLLIFAACPLSMVFMMRRMSGAGASCGTKQQDAQRDGQVAAGGGSEPSAAAPTAGGAELRELEEEVNRLKAELQLRDQERST